MVSIDQIKQLRDEMGGSLTECKKALQTTGGDFQKAKEILKQRGQNLTEKKAERITNQGVIENYLHPGKKVGVMVELRCESDFVARAQEFQKLAHEICLQVAAMNPLFLDTENIPEEFLAGERKIYQEQLRGSGKPQKILDEIVEGKLKKYKEEISLMSQLWIRDETKTVRDLVEEHIAKLGENIIVKRFTRFEIQPSQ